MDDKDNQTLELDNGSTVNVPDPFLQKHLEAFQLSLRDVMKEQGEDDITDAVYRGVMVKAAIACGWVEGLEPEVVGDLRPAVVKAISTHIHLVVNEAQTLDPN